MTQQEDAIRLAVKMRRHEPVEELPIFQVRGNFLVIAQGDAVILLTKKQLFDNLQRLLRFAKEGE